MLMRFVAILWLTAALGFSQTITSLSDIQYWVGSGTNESALVIDFETGSGTTDSFAWGYRWDGTATGEQMLEAIAGQSTINNINNSGTSLVLTGVDGNLTMSGTWFSFGNEVIALTYSVGSTTYSQSAATTPGFWNYWVVNGDTSLPLPGDYNATSPVADTWFSSTVGFSDFTLTNDSWNGWAWSNDPTFSSAPSPAPPIAALAVPEPTALALLAFAGAGALLILHRRVEKSVHTG